MALCSYHKSTVECKSHAQISDQVKEQLHGLFRDNVFWIVQQQMSILSSQLHSIRGEHTHVNHFSYVLHLCKDVDTRPLWQFLPMHSWNSILSGTGYQLWIKTNWGCYLTSCTLYTTLIQYLQAYGFCVQLSAPQEYCMMTRWCVATWLCEGNRVSAWVDSSKS